MSGTFPRLSETGPITQTMTQSGGEVTASETVSSGGVTDTWNETGTLTSTLSDDRVGRDHLDADDLVDLERRHRYQHDHAHRHARNPP